MAQDILVREARVQELDMIESLVKTAYEEFKALFPEEVWQAWMKNIGATVHSEAGVVMVAEGTGKIRGVVKFYPDAGQAAMGQWPQGAAAMRVLAVSAIFSYWASSVD